jgi:hypothetical protein
MRLHSSSFVPGGLVLGLIGGLSAGCALPDGDAEGSRAAELRSQSAFVLSVSTDENPVSVTTSSGSNSCPDSCQFAYIAGTSLTLHAGFQNLGDCLRFSGWSGACATQGQTCTLVINSDLSTTALYSRIFGCTPQ